MEPDSDDELLDDDEKKGRIVPDIVRRAVLTGVGALFMTEEGVRNMLGEMKMPKDALGFLLGQAEKTRAEVGRVVTQELRRFLESDMLQRQVTKLLSGMTLEVNATVRLKPSGETSVKARVHRKKGEEPDPEPVAGADEIREKGEPGA